MLYHFSEKAGITRFEARPPLAHPGARPYVWAIDEWHSPLYFVPSECPRVCFWPLPTTTKADLETWWKPATGRIVIAIEGTWLQRVQEVVLYRYELPPKTFEDCEDHGVHVSPLPVEPIAMEAMDSLPQRIVEAEAELRVCPSLVPLAKAVMQTSLHWSLIRMRNVIGWEMEPGQPCIPKTSHEP
jgi:hypothetical protein